MKVRNQTLTRNITVVVFVFFFLPILILGCWIYLYSKHEIKQQALNTLKIVNRSRANLLNNIELMRIEEIKEMASRPVFTQLSDQGHNSPELIGEIQARLEVAYKGFKSDRNDHLSTMNRESAFALIGVWDVNGTIIANTDKELIGKRMPQEYLENVRKYGTYFAGLKKDALKEQNVIIILQQIKNQESQKFAGAVIFKIKPELINAVVTDRMGLGQTGETYIVEKSLRMVTPSRFLKDSVLNTIVNTSATDVCFKKEKPLFAYQDYRGSRVLGAFEYLPDLEWCVVTEIDQQEILKPINILTQRMSIVIAILMFMGGFFIYGMYRIIVIPLKKLDDSFQLVTQGDLSVLIPARGNNEISRLGKSFNQMVVALRDARMEIKTKNAELTLRLEQAKEDNELLRNTKRATFNILEDLDIEKKRIQQVEKELRQQKEDLEKVNLELDSFVYTASHDLRAPLRGISSFATFLQDDYKDKIDDEGKEYIDEIRKGTERLSRLIDDLLTLSRITRIKNPFEDVAITDLVKTIVERIEFDVKSMNVDLRIQDDMPMIHCDRIKLGEVFLNLVNNAIKFSSKNTKESPRVEVGYKANGTFHQFFVKDNGIGIAPEHHEQVFGMFKRLHTAKEYDGTGAGLSIVKRVIDDHKGKIWIESELGKGAAFWFTIPVNLKTEKKDGE